MLLILQALIRTGWSGVTWSLSAKNTTKQTNKAKWPYEIQNVQTHLKFPQRYSSGTQPKRHTTQPQLDAK